MEQFIVLIGGFIVIGIAWAIIAFAIEHKDIAATVIILIIILATVGEIFPGAKSAFFDTIHVIISAISLQSILAIGVIVVISGIVISCIRRAIRKSKANKAMEWLNHVGVGKIDPSSDIKKTMDYLMKQNQALFLSDCHVLSMEFGMAICKEIYQRRFISESELHDICKQVLPTYDSYYFDAIFKALSKGFMLLLVPYSANCGPDYYVALPFVQDCEQVLEIEGGATHTQMIFHLKSAFPESKLNNYYDELAQVVLDYAVTSGKAHTVEGPEGNLYVVNNPSAECKMVRREISLD